MTGALLPGGAAYRPVQASHPGLIPGFAGLVGVARNLRGNRQASAIAVAQTCQWSPSA